MSKNNENLPIYFDLILKFRVILSHNYLQLFSKKNPTELTFYLVTLRNRGSQPLVHTPRVKIAQVYVCLSSVGFQLYKVHSQ